MKKSRTRNAVRLGVMLIMFTLFGGSLMNSLYASSQAASGWKNSSLNLSGLAGEANNTAFVSDRYVLAAPYAPSIMPTDPAAIDQLDNYNLYLVDSKKPSNNVQVKPLQTAIGNMRLYYPSKLMFDGNSNTVYVRGTRFEPADGDVKEIETIAYTQVDLSDDGKLVSGDVVMIDIKGVGNQATSSDAPVDFALGYGGDLLAFTNGASIFTYRLHEGYVYQVDIVKPEDYGENSRISSLNIDAETNILTVCWNRKVTDADGNVKNTSELSFYDLSSDGTMQLRKRLSPGDFPNGAYIPAGSTVEVFSKKTNDPLLSAWVITNDGVLSQIDLPSDGSSTLKPIITFDALAGNANADLSSRILKYDSAKRTIGIVAQGFTAQIRKPSNGHRGGVIRSLSLITPVEQPAMAFARFGKSYKVTSSNVFVDEFSGEDGLTGIVDGPNSQWLVAARSGNVLALNSASDPASATLSLLTQVGPRTSQISYSASRDSIVAINSFGVDETQEQITDPGALVVARQTGDGSQSLSVASASVVSVMSKLSVTPSPTMSIRRPCNVNKK